MTSPRIKSKYTNNVGQPLLVDRWEAAVNQAPSDLEALIQLTYFQALQIRTIKVILVWTMVVVPIAFVVGLVVLANALAEPTLD